MTAPLRQDTVLAGILARAATLDPVDGVIVIGSFASGRADALSDLDLLVVVGAGRLDEAWAARRRVAGDVHVTWTPAQESRAGLRWCNWLTHDLVKIECGFAEPGGKDLAEPFEVVLGPPALADTFPRVDASVVAERARRRRQAQRDFDPEELTAEERLDWTLAELKSAARSLQGRDRGERERRA